MTLLFNRYHPESLFRNVPLENIEVCLGDEIPRLEENDTVLIDLFNPNHTAAFAYGYHTETLHYNKLDFNCGDTLHVLINDQAVFILK